MGSGWVAGLIDVVRAWFENAKPQVANQLNTTWMHFQPAATVGLPGTGLSWRESLSDKSQSKRDRQQKQRGENGYTSTEWIITDLMDILCEPKSYGAALWDGGLAQQTLEHPETPRQIREQALLLKSPETIELHLRRAKGVAATKRAANEVLAALSAVMSWTKEQGWWVEG